MRWLAIFGVLAYRLLIRPFSRRRCLYEESCSTFALRVLRQRGARVAASLILSRLRSCRLPASACFVVDAGGRVRLLAAESASGSPVPSRALELCAERAARQLAARAQGEP